MRVVIGREALARAALEYQGVALLVAALLLRLGFSGLLLCCGLGLDLRGNGGGSSAGLAGLDDGRVNDGDCFPHGSQANLASIHALAAADVVGLSLGLRCGRWPPPMVLASLARPVSASCRRARSIWSSQASPPGIVAGQVEQVGLEGFRC
jgi:hypothetical protein